MDQDTRNKILDILNELADEQVRPRVWILKKLDELVQMAHWDTEIFYCSQCSQNSFQHTVGLAEGQDPSDSVLWCDLCASDHQRRGYE